MRKTCTHPFAPIYFVEGEAETGGNCMLCEFFEDGGPKEGISCKKPFASVPIQMGTSLRVTEKVKAVLARFMR